MDARMPRKQFLSKSATLAAAIPLVAAGRAAAATAHGGHGSTSSASSEWITSD